MADGPPNKKNRPCGAGTTTPARKAARAGKQWSALEKADPTSSECLEKHLKALEEATAKAKAKLEKAKAAESSSTSGSSYYSSSSSSATPAKPLEKRPKQGTPAQQTPHALPLHRGKQGPRAVLKPAAAVEGTLEKETSKKEGGTLEKETSKKEGGTLEKETPKKKEGTLEKETSKKEGGTLEKETSKKEGGTLEKETSKKEGGTLEKETSTEAREVTLEKESSKAKRLVVIVDWHETLEKGDKVSWANSKALTKLLEKADVHLLSWVGSKKRELKVVQDMSALAQVDQLTAMTTCYKKTGEGGKVDYACEVGACAIFDDCREIIQEGLRWNLQVYPIRTHHQQHTYLDEDSSYYTFAQAVDSFLAWNFGA